MSIHSSAQTTQEIFSASRQCEGLKDDRPRCRSSQPVTELHCRARSDQRAQTLASVVLNLHLYGTEAELLGSGTESDRTVFTFALTENAHTA